MWQSHSRLNRTSRFYHTLPYLTFRAFPSRPLLHSAISNKKELGRSSRCIVRYVGNWEGKSSSSRAPATIDCVAAKDGQAPGHREARTGRHCKVQVVNGGWTWPHSTQHRLEGGGGGGGGDRQVGTSCHVLHINRPTCPRSSPLSLTFFPHLPDASARPFLAICRLSSCSHLRCCVFAALSVALFGFH